MNERELSSSLLELDVAAAGDPRKLTQAILDKDRRRLRLLTFLGIGAWTIALLLILLAMVNFALLFPRHAKIRMDFESGAITAAERDTQQTTYLTDYQIASFQVTLSLLALLPAALFTLLLVSATRRATLRQVNANLIEIGQELKALRQSLAKGAGPAA
jgi:hypothetical protein